MNSHWLSDMGKNTRILGSNVRLRAACKWLCTERREEQQMMLPRIEKLVRTVLVSSSVLQNGAACGMGCPPAFPTDWKAARRELQTSPLMGW